MHRTAFFITPAVAEEEWLGRIIQSLASEHAGVAFQPHLTVYTCLLEEEESPAELLREAVRFVGPITLDPLGLEFSDLFTRSLYLRFQLNDVVKQISSRLHAMVRHPVDYPLMPHISLMYTALPLVRKQEIAGKIEIPQGSIAFDRCGALATPSKVESNADVLSWRQLAAMPLNE